MLEVPDAQRKPAEIVVGAVPETQIVVSRTSYTEGFDNPFAALTIASESLRVIDAIYGWFQSSGSVAAASRIVLYSGQRLPLASTTPGSVVAAIRGNQPWTEHSIPRIGDHTGGG
jgi:hypothetical protein